jgi:hypothetical protein
MRSVAEPAMTKDACAWGAFVGATSALLAARGFTSLPPVFVPGDDLGERWHLLDVGFKPWPATGWAHPFIDAAIRLRERHALRAELIAAVRLVGDAHLRTFCEPDETRRRPRTLVEATDSVLFATAKALTNGAFGLADLQPAGLDQPEALAIVDRVTYAVGAPGRLSVTTTDGATVEVLIDHTRRYVLTPERAMHKLRDCARFAARPLAEADLQRAAALVEQLEDVPDVRGLAAAFSGVEGV